MRKNILTAILLFALCQVAFTAGISISPGACLTFVRELGVEAPLPPLKIVNVNDSPMFYTISTTAGTNLRGYYPIADIEWAKVETQEVTIQAYDSVFIPIKITIPDDPSNLNRAWGFIVSVTQSPVGKDGGGLTLLQLGAQGHWLIETKSMPNTLSSEYAEPLVISPSLWTATFAEDEPTTGELSFSIMNNDNKPHTYTFMNYSPLYGDEIRGMSLDIIPLIGDADSWVSDKGWVEAKKSGFLFFKSSPKVKLNPGETAEQAVKFNLPREALGEKIYESLIFIKVDGEYKDGRFVRFVIR
jgi:hypothetical protein